MAILTWRNVDAPNFSGALEGYRTASQLLSNAVTAGKDAVGAYTQANSDAADRAIMNRALGVQGSEEYRNALASGSLVGPDGQNASMKMLGDLDTRTGTLLNRDVVRENLGQTQYSNQRGREDDAALDAAGPDIALARTLARNNDQETLNKLLQTSPTIQKLRPGQLASLLTGVDTLSTSFQGRRSSDVTFDQGQWRFGNEVRDSNDAQTAQAAWLEIQRDNATPDKIQGAINARAGTMSPGAMARLNNYAKGAGVTVNGLVGVAAPGAGVPSSGSGGGDSFAGSIPFAETRNYVSKITGNAGDLSGLTNEQKLEKLVPLVLNQESGNRRYDAQGKLIQGPVTSSGERAQGEMQVMPATSRDPGYGVKPAKDNSPDEAARVGRDYLSAMLNKYNGNVDQALAAYNAGPGAVDGWLKNKDPAAALTEDVRRRAGMNLGVDLTRQEMRERAGQNQATGIFPELDALQASRKKSVEIADQLIGETGPLRGANRAEVLDYVNWIVDNSNGRINPAMAGEMLARNVGSADNAFERTGSAFLDIFGMPFGRKIRTDNLTSGPDGIRLKDEGVYQMMDEYLSGGTSTRRTGQQALAAEDQTLESLRTKYNAADALYREMQVQSKSRPGLAATLPEYQKNRDALEKALNLAIASANSNETLMPSRDRPKPPILGTPAEAAAPAPARAPTHGSTQAARRAQLTGALPDKVVAAQGKAQARKKAMTDPTVIKLKAAVDGARSGREQRTAEASLRAHLTKNYQIDSID